MRRMLTAAALAGLTFASFAGCSSGEAGPSPSPSPMASTGALACSPAVASFSWGEPRSESEAVASDIVVTFSKRGTQLRKSYSGGIPIVWDTAQLSRIAPTSAALEEWKIALRDDLAGTGTVPADFGFPVAPDSRDITVLPVLGAPSRVILASVRVPITRVSFVVTCPGSTVSGSLTAPKPDDFRVLTYECGSSADPLFTAEEVSRCP